MQNQNPPTNPPSSFSQPPPMTSLRPPHHRRAHSEFRLPPDLDLLSDSFDAGAPSATFDDLGSEDDFFSTFMDADSFGSGLHDVSSGGGGDGGGGGERNMRSRHRHCNSVDSSSGIGESVEAKKAMAPEKLAELWSVDPKRAKRIIANRQSASRSKERKAHYISELERKVQTLQTEATTLSAQMTLFQRDTTGLYSENTELNIRLQAMEQQAQLRDALNEALKHEVERLRIATEQTANGSDAYNLGMQHVPYSLSAVFLNQQHQEPPQFHSLQTDLSTPQHLMHASAHSEMMQQDPLGRFQGLDISSSDSSHL